MSRSGFFIGSNMLALSVLHGSLDEREIWGRTDTCVQMVESLCGPPETITTFLINYTPIQIKSLKNMLLWSFLKVVNFIKDNVEAPRHRSPQKTRWISYKEKLEGPLHSNLPLSRA